MNLGIGLGLTNYLRVPTVALDPDAAIAALFESGEEGAWYDPSDSTTVFQDAAGRTPATVGDPVGLILDKSKGLTLGAEAVTNGTFDTDTDWNKGPGWSISGGVASFATTGGTSNLDQICLVIGKTYQISWDQTTASGVMVVFAGVSSPVSSFGGTERYTIRVEAKGNTRLYFQAQPTFSGSIDNVTVKELPGNHATQTTSAARPILQQSGATAVLGSELVTNGTFDTDTLGWNTTGSWVSNQLEIGGGEQANQQVTLGSGTFRLTWDQTITAGTRTRVRLRNSANSADVGPFNYYFGSGSFSVDVTTSTGLTVIFMTEAADTVLIDNISVKQITSWSGGLRYLDFDGVDDKLQCIGFLGSAFKSVMMAADAYASSPARVVGIGASGNYAGRYVEKALWYLPNETSGRLAGAWANNTTAVASFVSDEVNVSGWVNGTLGINNAPTIAAPSNNLYLGANHSTAYAQCKIYGLVIVETVLGTADRESAESYLANKSGVTL